MGITNSSVIKMGVDLLTGLITVVNKILSAIEKIGGGFGKAAASIALCLGVMKLGRAIIVSLADKAFKLAASFTSTGAAAAGAAVTTKTAFSGMAGAISKLSM